MNQKHKYFIVIFLIVASLIAYSRILSNDFINLDDPLHITQNDHIKSGIHLQNIKWAFTSIVNAHWFPLTLISHMLDWSLFGSDASGHHMVSLLLHIGAAIFLFLFLNKTTNNIWPSAFAAAFFALHPLRVEAVAWAADRKDVLSMFFGMASLYAYSFYVENNRCSRYIFCLILFIFGLMSKPIILTLPFLMILLDYWPLKRCPMDLLSPFKNRRQIFGKLLREKVPFIFFTIVSCIITFRAQDKSHLVASLRNLSFDTRVQNMFISYVSYLEKTFWPFDFAVYYSYERSFPLGNVLISCIILIGITMTVIYVMKKMPFLFVGWFWYLGTLVPVIGLVQIADIARADRYTYLPSVGIVMMITWGIPFLFYHKVISKKILFTAGIAVLTILSILTWQQCRYWKNSIELYNHTLKVTKNTYFIRHLLGRALAEKGNTKEAIDQYDEAIKLKPKNANAYQARGNAYEKLGQYQQAFAEYNKAVRLEPNDKTYNSRGLAYYKLGQYREALADHNEAIRLNPDVADAYQARGNAYEKLGQYQQALADYNEAIRLNPDVADVYSNRGTIYFKLGQYQQALVDYNKAIIMKPKSADAYNNRGLAYGKLGQYQQAVDDFNQATSLKPDYIDAYNNRGFAYFLQGNKERGCSDAQKACSLGMCKLFEFAQGKGFCR